jgi:RNA polymerase sigma factor for flagellar operon FliA
MHEPVPVQTHEPTNVQTPGHGITAGDDEAHSPSSGDGHGTSEGELWARWKSQGDPQARQALIERHLPYARTVAARCYARRIHDEIEFGDYFQLASLAMVESVDRYRPGQGAQFRTFAAHRMHGAILDGLEKLTEKQQQVAVRQRLERERLEAAKLNARDRVQGSSSVAAAREDELFAYLAEVGIGLALGVLLEETGMFDRDAGGVATDADQHYKRVEMAQLKGRLAAMVEALPPAQRSVLQWHYRHDQSFVDIAQRLDLSRGRVSQIHKQALESLRQALAGCPPCDVAC